MLNIRKFDAHRMHSKIPSEYPNKSLFPNYYNARKIEVTINEGEILFIPAGWFHFVFSEDANPHTKLNVALNNWSKEIKCDCKYSLNPNDYHLECKIYNESQIQPQNLSKPFKITSTIHKKIIFDVNFLKNYYKNQKIRVHTSNTPSFVSPIVNFFEPEKSQVTLLTFDEFYQGGLDGKYYYIGQNRLQNMKIKTLPFIDKTCTEKHLWINFGNVNSNLHYDTTDNYIIQLQGSKRIILFPPSEREKLYLYNPLSPKFLCYFMNR